MESNGSLKEEPKPTQQPRSITLIDPTNVSTRQRPTHSEATSKIPSPKHGLEDRTAESNSNAAKPSQKEIAKTIELINQHLWLFDIKPKDEEKVYSWLTAIAELEGTHELFSQLFALNEYICIRISEKPDGAYVNEVITVNPHTLAYSGKTISDNKPVFIVARPEVNLLQELLTFIDKKRPSSFNIVGRWLYSSRYARMQSQQKDAVGSSNEPSSEKAKPNPYNRLYDNLLLISNAKVVRIERDGLRDQLPLDEAEEPNLTPTHAAALFGGSATIRQLVNTQNTQALNQATSILIPEHGKVSIRPLTCALALQRWENAEAILAIDSVDVNYHDDLMPPLWYAVTNSNPQIAKAISSHTSYKSNKSSIALNRWVSFLETKSDEIRLKKKFPSATFARDDTEDSFDPHFNKLLKLMTQLQAEISSDNPNQIKLLVTAMEITDELSNLKNTSRDEIQQHRTSEKLLSSEEAKFLDKCIDDLCNVNADDFIATYFDFIKLKSEILEPNSEKPKSVNQSRELPKTWLSESIKAFYTSATSLFSTAATSVSSYYFIATINILMRNTDSLFKLFEVKSEHIVRTFYQHTTTATGGEGN